MNFVMYEPVKLC